MANIIFTDITEQVIEDYYPKPASFFVPDWYKQMDSYLTQKKIPDGDGTGTGTIKKCMPVFDAITAGYILVLPADVFVTQKAQGEDGKLSAWFEWADLSLIQFHPPVQAPNHPSKNKTNENESYPKFMNPWVVETPKGYSTLFMQPMHRESPFTILEGIVDTDFYSNAVNFPFVLKDPSFEGLIPAGTPIAQVIPFERKEWKMEIGAEKELDKQKKVFNKLKTKMFDSYKIQFRQKKEYK